MVLKLRLARVAGPGGSRRHKPVYNLVLAHARTARDSLPLEVLGTYEPVATEIPGAELGSKKRKRVQLDVSRIKYWLGTGAQPSDTVWRLLSMIGLLAPRYLPTGPQSLKAARFPTHERQYASAAHSSHPTRQAGSSEQEASAGSELGQVVMSIREKRLRADAKISGGSTARTASTIATASPSSHARLFSTESSRPGNLAEGLSIGGHLRPARSSSSNASVSEISPTRLSAGGVVESAALTPFVSNKVGQANPRLSRKAEVPDGEKI